MWDGVHIGYESGGSYRMYLSELDTIFVLLDVNFLEKLYKHQDSVAFDVGEESNGGPESDVDETIPQEVSDGSRKLGYKGKQKEYSDANDE